MAVTERVLLAGIGLLLLTAPPAATALDPSAGSPREDTAELAPLSGPLQVVRDEERDALEALALYQEPLRTAILEVSRHPQALVGLERIQTRTRQAFLTRIETLPETTQDQVWELVRFPSLVSALAAAEDRSSAELEALARGYPQEARAAATRLGAERHELVRALA
ncbi:MAG: hypothetical protein OEY15_08380, partial [Myxococcales bacterium]|nr:hypothetical protein [Myxococcales bacterium]